MTELTRSEANKIKDQIDKHIQLKKEINETHTEGVVICGKDNIIQIFKTKDFISVIEALEIEANEIKSIKEENYINAKFMYREMEMTILIHDDEKEEWSEWLKAVKYKSNVVMKEINKIELHSDDYEQITTLYILDSSKYSNELKEIEDYYERESFIFEVLGIINETDYEINPGAKYTSYSISWSDDFKQTLLYKTTAYNI